MARTQQVIILGDSPLVIELANVCHTNNYRVLCRKDKKKPPYPEYCITPATFPRSVTCAFELSNDNPEHKRNNLISLDKLLSPSTIIFSSSIVTTIAEQAGWVRHPERIIGISAFGTLLSNRLYELSIPPAASTPTVKRARMILQTLGKETSIVQDRIGMVLPRILCMIINEAYFACMEEIAQPSDIDLAMKLGTNYPHGPIAWSKAIGFRQVVAVLDALYKDLGEDRYRVAPILRQLAL